MELTDEMKRAFYLVENTNDCMFITGKAGTGKTTFLRYLVEHIHKTIVIAASTGIAAINAGGVTLHSLFSIPMSIQDPNATLKGNFTSKKLDLVNAIDVLVIDEISMVRPDTIDYIDRKLRLARLRNEPFGGIQVVMFGDLYQLPPVLKKDERDMLLMAYRGVYFFYANVLREHGFHVIELNKVFRQSDKRFIEILNHIRQYKLTYRDIEDLDELRDRRESERFDNNYVHVCAQRKEVQRINNEMLGEPTHCFVTKYSDGFSPSFAPVDPELYIRIGARVMLLVNDPNREYCNGSMGTVEFISETEIGVYLDTGKHIKVMPYEWKGREYKLNGDKIESVEKGSAINFPLMLAWAITIHKSQGLTFDKLIIHTKGIFAPGQLYVALSRCTSMEGIISDSFIDKHYIFPNHELTAFETAYKSTDYFFNSTTYRSMRLR